MDFPKQQRGALCVCKITHPYLNVEAVMFSAYFLIMLLSAFHQVPIKRRGSVRGGESG